jgi:hypothetical protein
MQDSDSDDERIIYNSIVNMGIGTHEPFLLSAIPEIISLVPIQESNISENFMHVDNGLIFEFQPHLFVERSKLEPQVLEKRVREAIASANTFLEWTTGYNNIVGEFKLVEPYEEYELTGKVDVNRVTVRIEITEDTVRPEWYRITIGRISPCSSFLSWNRILVELVSLMKPFCIPNQGLLFGTMFIDELLF